MKALIISADNFEDTELLVPFYRLIEEGIKVDVASITKDKIKGKHGYLVEVTKIVDDINPDEYEILILPGGKAPSVLREDKKVVEIAKYFMDKNKPVAAICHGPQILISAGAIKGKHATCYRTVKQELIEAGAIYEDKEVIVDGNLITSRQPSDLPYFIREILKKLKEHRDV